MDKIYISAQELLEDSFDLGLKVLQDGFRPNYIAALWRGGTPVGVAVQELFKHAGLPSDHIAVRTSAYEGMKLQKRVAVHSLGYLTRELNADDRLLIVDDVFDSGSSIKAVIMELRARLRRNMPRDVRVATVWYKPANVKVDVRPHYWMHESDKWLVFPHELDGVTDLEAQKGARVARAVTAAVSLNIGRESDSA